MQDVNRIHAGFSRNMHNIDEMLQQFSADLDLQVTHIGDTIAFVEKLDPANEQQQMNSFLGVGVADELRTRLGAAKHLANVAVAFDKQLSREQLGSHTAMLGKVENTIATYEAKHTKARALVRVPKAVSDDKALLATARKTLGNPDYEVGELRRLVINADKVHREMKSSSTEFDKVDVSLSGNITLSGTETTYLYSWDQYQVATVEPVDDTFFIFFNTLKSFTSGGPTTPLNRWILAARIQGNEIPEANIDRE